MDTIKNEIIKEEIQAGLAQIDDSLTISEFSCVFDSVKRKLYVRFTATNQEGEEMRIDMNY